VSRLAPAASLALVLVLGRAASAETIAREGAAAPARALPLPAPGTSPEEVERRFLGGSPQALREEQEAEAEERRREIVDAVLAKHRRWQSERDRPGGEPTAAPSAREAR
jgi:hypothetical protein